MEKVRNTAWSTKEGPNNARAVERGKSPSTLQRKTWWLIRHFATSVRHN